MYICIYVLVKAPLRVYYGELLNEDMVERLIRHEVQPSALIGLKTTYEFNNSSSNEQRQCLNWSVAR